MLKVFGRATRAPQRAYTVQVELPSRSDDMSEPKVTEAAQMAICSRSSVQPRPAGSDKSKLPSRWGCKKNWREAVEEREERVERMTMAEKEWE